MVSVQKRLCIKWGAVYCRLTRSTDDYYEGQPTQQLLSWWVPVCDRSAPPSAPGCRSRRFPGLRGRLSRWCEDSVGHPPPITEAESRCQRARAGAPQRCACPPQVSVRRGRVVEAGRQTQRLFFFLASEVAPLPVRGETVGQVRMRRRASVDSTSHERSGSLARWTRGWALPGGFARAVVRFVSVGA